MRISTAVRLSTAILALAAAAPALSQQKAGPTYGTFGIDLTAQKAGVKPGDDFWTFANGGWDARTTIAADRVSAGNSVILVDQAELQVQAIINDAVRAPAATGPGAQQIGNLYAGFMDESGIEQRGAAPLKPYFATIDAASDKAKLQTLFATVGYASPVEPVARSVGPDQIYRRGKPGQPRHGRTRLLPAAGRQV
jgi:putative endopeptidase